MGSYPIHGSATKYGTSPDNVKGNEEDEGLMRIIDYIDEKLELYDAHLESEKARKEKTMDPVKRADRDKKKAAAEAARKKARDSKIIESAKALQKRRRKR